MEALENYIKTRTNLFRMAGIEPQSMFVKTDGPVKKVHYLHLGTGDPLILIHGGLSHSSEWINILKPLAKNYSLYVVDRPGHGLTDPINYKGVDYRKSAVAFLKTFMDATGLKDANFLGNSMGGYFAICFALEHPERVKKLVLIGAPAGMNIWIPPMLRALGTKFLNRILWKTVARPSISGVKSIHKQILVNNINNVSKEYLEHCYYGQLLPGSEIAFTSLLENVLTLKGWKKELYLSDQLDKLKVPVYFIWGDKDAFENPKTGMQKAKKIENHTFEIIKNAGHCPWIDQPEKCASLILNMLKN